MRTSIAAALLVALSCVSCPPLTASAAPITGNSGPGGFAATNVSSDLVLWLDAGTISQADNTQVGVWANSAFTGSSHDATQSTASSQPVFRTGISGLPNDQPVLQFNGNLLIVDPNLYPANRDLTVIAVARTNLATSSANIVGRRIWTNTVHSGDQSAAAVGQDNDVLAIGTAPGFSSVLTSGALSVTEPSISTFRQATSQNRLDVFLDGASVHSNTSFSFTTDVGSGTQMLIGAQVGLGRAWNGDIAEIIAFDRALNAVERTLVENHLSAKYGVSIANDLYAGKDTSLGKYDRDVFGIGSDGISTVASSGAGGFGIEAMPGTLGANDWVLAGHKHPAGGIVPLEPAGVLGGGERWERVWYVDVTGNVDATLAFDFSDAGLGMPLSTDEFTLLYSATNDFDWTILSAGAEFSGDTILFNIAGLADGYFTLGINVSVVPEPSSFALLALGMAAWIGAIRRRRMRSRAQL